MKEKAGRVHERAVLEQQKKNSSYQLLSDDDDDDEQYTKPVKVSDQSYCKLLTDIF